MPGTRPRFQYIRDAEALRVLAAPLAIQLLEALHSHGEATAADLAEHVGRRREIVYYHLHRLVAAGLICIAEERPTGRRPVVVYRAAAAEVRLDPPAGSRNWKEGLTRVTRASLRALERDAVAAIQRGHLPGGSPRELMFFMRRVRLDEAGLRRVNRLLEAVSTEVLRLSAAARGTTYSLGFALAPAPPRSRTSARRPPKKERS